MPSRYAAETKVPQNRTVEQIRGLIAAHGGREITVIDGEIMSGVGFVMQGRKILFKVPMPAPSEKRFTQTLRGPRSESAAADLYQQARRAIWRQLALVLRAKLEAVAAGIVLFEDEFLAATIAPGTGLTVGETFREPMAEAYRIGDARRLLPAPGV